MLTRLTIRDFVIVDASELEFSPGFTVLSGETGAGKSILLDALGLLLGDKGDSSLVRQGASRAELEAEFDTGADRAVGEWLDEQGFTGEDSLLLLRRVFDAGGRSRCFINGSSATAAQLKDLGEMLVDIHGQHAHQSLMKNDAQRRLLDEYAGATDLARDVKTAYLDWQSAVAAWQESQKSSEAVLARREQLGWQLEELKRLNPQADEWEALNSEHQRLTYSVELIRGAQGAEAALAGEDVSALSLLRSALSQLAELKTIDAAIEPAWAALNSAAETLNETARDLRHYADRVEVDPDRLAELDGRMGEWMKLARKHRQAPEALPAFLAQTEHELASLAQLADVEVLAQQAAEREARYRERAGHLSAQRQRAAVELSQRVTAELAELAMNHHRFAVAMEPTAKPTAAGLETVEFQIAAHESMSLRPLAKTASGGELSRISLAIQVVAAKVAAVPTLIFDEVDVGIGGRVAEIVGRKLRELGACYQVLCVTHLPQVAACGHQHWRVQKSNEGAQVRSAIQVLDEAERGEEVARMLGGVDITDTTREHAREMLRRAQ